MSCLNNPLNGIKLLGPSITSPTVELVASAYNMGARGRGNSASVYMQLDAAAPAFLRELADKAEALLAKAAALKALNASEEVPA